MKCQILHETKNRMRVHFCKENMTIEEADKADAYLKSISGIDDVTVYERTGDLIIYYSFDRNELIEILAHFSFENDEVKNIEIVGTARLVQREYEEKLIMTIALRYFRKIFYPLPLRIALAYIKSIKYILKALKSLAKGQLNVSVLDAVAITVSLIRGDFETASSVMFLLKIGEILEEWTHKKSVSDLANTMSLGIEKVWLKNKNDEEVLVPTNKVNVGDKIVLRTSNMIPLDGEVIDGGVTVNQSAITGESVAVNKTVGSHVYAGTVVESGECIIKVTQINGQGKYDRIVKMIEDSEKLKSSLESKASNLADRLVPLSLFGTIFTYAITRNVTKALSILMVDYSCALKLTMPVAVLSAINECSNYNATVKGGKYLEALSKANVVVFDKTGTVTEGRFTVTEVFPEGMSEQELLNIAATAESCSRHPIARSLREAGNVRPSEGEVLEIEDITGRGVSAFIDGHHVYVGNAALLEEHGINFSVPSRPGAAIHVAVDNVYAGHIMIADRIKDGAFDALEELRAQGVKSLVMLTGDVRSAAKTVAASLNFDMVKAELTLDGKITAVEYMLSKKATGACLAFVGDGVGDAPVMTHADIGIALGAVNEYSAIDAADVVLMDEDIRALPEARSLCRSVTDTAGQNILLSLAAKAILVVLGVFGVINIWIAALAELCVLAAAIANAGKNDIKFEKENIDERSVQ